ncbi:MAG: bifunctional diguanylate cyclase/phosphodiesterase [Candidatus Sedimenticola sp. PURPLELP]
MHDKLTHLLDRQHFIPILDEEVAESVEYKVLIALLIIDISRFNRINTYYGQHAGDQVLSAVARILSEVRREGDHIARLGGDQFAMLLSPISNPGHAELAAHKILRLLDVPIQLEEKQIRCSAKIGISTCPLNATEADQLFQTAEKALKLAKQSDEPIGIIEAKEQDEVSENWDIELELEGAIERSELMIYFQPKISIKTGQPVGAEALIRWNNRSRGIIPPAEFLPVAEELGLIKTFTVWMVNSALRHSAEWTDKFGQLHVSVNIPTGLLAQPDFPDLIESAEQLWKTGNVSLCIEVLEESIIKDTAYTFSMLKELRSNGIKVAIDDFGTGYSSLSYFRDIPTDELKIDQSFIQGLLTDEANSHIVQVIIDLAHRFGLSVVAEGVEEESTLERLKLLDCDIVQGNYYSKPMPAREFQQWIERF